MTSLKRRHGAFGDAPALLRHAARLALLMAGALILGACQPGLSGSAGSEPLAQRADTAAPGGAGVALSTDACLASAVLPVAAPGSVVADQTETPGEVHRFAVPCPGQIDEAFLASLQRALIVRGYHEGAVTGTLDAATAQAVRRYQRPRGLDSDILSLDAARALGLLPAARGAF